MTRTSGISCKQIFAGTVALGLFIPLAAAHAVDSNLYNFTGGIDGGNPDCGLISGGKGVGPAKLRLFGTTEVGGANGYGTVFEVDGPGLESVLYSFTGGSDGASPVAGLVADASGNLYGTTQEGGTFGFGVVFKLAPGGSETALYSFTGGADGAHPMASLIMDKAGNLYGTTRDGGSHSVGVIFEVAPDGGESVLHPFAGSDGAFPLANVTMDKAGNLYGTTQQGGTKGLGTVFKLARGGGLSVLHSFGGGSDGEFPDAGVILDKKLNLYGTTVNGGTSNDGVVFEVTQRGKETILYTFAGGSDGANPVSGVTMKKGFLYGTTSLGGSNNAGTVFKTPAKPGSDTVIYSFTGGSDGSNPEGGVLALSGNLFGTAFAGGNSGCTGSGGCGVVFEITP
jgi:uncharacterized repeat protein (TIGR03803 family)